MMNTLAPRNSKIDVTVYRRGGIDANLPSGYKPHVVDYVEFTVYFTVMDGPKPCGFINASGWFEPFEVNRTSWQTSFHYRNWFSLRYGIWRRLKKYRHLQRRLRANSGSFPTVYVKAGA